MTRDEYRSNMALVYSFARVLKELPLAEMLEGISRAEAIGPMLDPTLYREKSKAMEEDRRALEAAQALAGVLP